MLHENIHDKFIQGLIAAYKQVRIGDPLDKNTLCGPLHTKHAVQLYKAGIEKTKAGGGKILYGGKHLSNRKGNFVEPTITSVAPGAEISKNEIFVPILHTMKIKVG